MVKLFYSLKMNAKLSTKQMHYSFIQELFNEYAECSRDMLR